MKKSLFTILILQQIIGLPLANAQGSDIVHDLDSEWKLLVCQNLATSFISALNERSYIYRSTSTNTYTCSTSSPPFGPDSCSSSPVTPEDAEEFTVDIGGSAPNLNQFVRVYKCKQGYTWISFHRYKDTECRDGNWTEILDFCVLEEIAPSNCSTLQDFGAVNNGEYIIIPIGVVTGTRETTLCDFSNSGGRWTVIAYGTSLTTPATMDSNSYTKPTTAYFFGIPNIVKLLTWNDEKFPAILKVVVKRAGTLIGEVVYGNFSISDNGMLESIGTYHGFIGDGLCHYLNTAFKNDIMYWGDGSPGMESSFLFGSLNRWRNETAVELTFMIRSIFHDRTLVCPPAIGVDPIWTTTSVKMTEQMGVGAKVEYSCIGELMLEGLSRAADTRTTSGVVTCVNDSTNGLMWDKVIDLPCRIQCPSNYNESLDGYRCMYFSTVKAESITHASHGCIAAKGSLYFPASGYDMEFAAMTESYFTALDLRMTPEGTNELNNTFFSSNLDVDSYTESAVAYPSAVLGTCQFISKSAEYTFALEMEKNCFNNHYYACSVPGVCFTSFIRPVSHQGCYKMANATSVMGPLAASAICNNYGASLPIPTTQAQFNDIVQLMKDGMDPGQTTAVILLGFYNNYSNWNSFGVHDDLDAFMANTLGPETDPKFYRTLRVTKNGVGVVTEVNPTDGQLDGSVSDGDFKILCEMSGPVGCAVKMPIPSSTDSSYTLLASNPIYRTSPLGSQVAYNCSRGYFVGGNQSLTFQNLTCYGQFGGWQPVLQPCLYVEVCFGKEPAVGPATTIIWNDTNPHGLDGNVTFSCPTFLRTATRGRNQTLTCLEDKATPKLQDQLLHSGFLVFSLEYQDSTVENCTVCEHYEDLLPLNITAPDITINTDIGNNITLTCIAGFHVSIGNNTQDLLCQGSGWSYSTVKSCYRACVALPPTPGLGMVLVPLTNDSVGSSLVYKCVEGLHLIPTASYPNLTTNVSGICIETGTWVLNLDPTQTLDCINVTIYDPPLPTPGVISRDWDGYTRTLGTNITYNCNFPSSVFLYNYKPNITLTASVDGWIPFLSQELFTCAYECALSLLPTVWQNITSDGVNTTKNRIENGTLNFTCQPGTYMETTANYLEVRNSTFANCTAPGTWALEFPDRPLACVQLVPENPPLPESGAISNWNNYSRTFGTNITYSCQAASAILLYNLQNKVTATASADGWVPKIAPELLACRRVCGETLPLPGLNMKSTNISNVFNRIEGEIFNFTCVNNTFLLTTQNYLEIRNSTSAVCNETGSWMEEFPGRAMDCYQLCADDPPTALNSTNNWDNYSRTSDIQINYACDEDTMFGNYESKWNLTCNGTHWTPQPDPLLFKCTKGCFNRSSSSIGNATMPEYTPYGQEGHNLTYFCPIGEASRTGSNRVSISCVNGSWTEAPSDFLCENACFEPPVKPGLSAEYNFTGDYTDGQIVHYNCSTGLWFLPGVTEYYSFCENHLWSTTEQMDCVPVTTPGPSTVKPEVLSPFPEDKYYQYTTDYHFSSLGEFSDVNGVVNNYQVVNGPFGFGTAVEVNSTKFQCLKKEKFVPDYETCIRNPNQCPDGLSFSIWEKPQFYVELLESVSASTTIEDPTKYRYVVSTGGDDQGHPGFAIMHMDHWIIAVVCTGERAWKAKALGHVRPLVWNNIGITWKNTEGLKLFVNGTQRGSDDAGRSVATQLPLSPTELMIGCHKDSSNANYRGFIDAVVDEFAIWERELNSTDVPLFKGGYAEELANMTSEDLVSKINRVDMTDPDQVNSAILFLTYLSNTAATPTSATPTAAASTAQSPTATSAATTSASPTVDSEAVKDLENLKKVFSAIINVDKMAESYTSHNLKMTRKMVTALSSLVKPENAQTWLHIQKDPNEGGEMSLLDGYFEYSRKLMQRTVYDNISVPYCFEENLDHLTDEMCKARLSDMKQRGSWVQKPNQYNPRYADEWSGPYDRAAVNLNVFSDERCLERPINTHSTVFNSASKAAHTRVNPSVIDASKQHIVDSRLLYFHLLADRARDGNGKIDTSQPLCQPDNDLMVKNPLRIKLEHNNKVIGLRKLEFHENETTSDITVRRCVWWNRNLSDFGAWDSTGCVVEATSEVYTKCLCDKFGLFAILAEKAEPIEVPEEPSWLTYIKYALYGLSALAITLYIIVVAISGDLKDQFHLMGVNLAVAILVGSVAIVVSDFEDIRADRHSNVAIGALIHFFYGAVGSWIYALGHGSFRAITSGVIGGRLQSYMFICWGMALACVGIPFVGALHELGTDPRCFISWNDNIKYVFFLPQIFYCGGGLFFAIVILCNLSTPALRKENLIEDYGSFCRGAAVLLILLSLTWVFGLLAFVRFNLGTDFNPIFQVLNSMAGLALFFLIGIGSNRFRMFLAGQAKTRRQMLKAYAFGLPGAKKDDIPANAATDATQKTSSYAKDKK